MPGLPPFVPLLRACSICEASVYCTDWYQRCATCGGYVCDQVAVAMLDRGIKIEERADGKMVLRLEDPE